MQIKNLGAGIFPDITSIGSNLCAAYASNGVARIVEVLTGVEIFSTPLSGVGFIRVGNHNGILTLGLRQGDGLSVEFYYLNPYLQYKFSGTFYNWPIAINADGFTFNDLTINSSKCEVRDWNNELNQTFPAFPGTGLAYLNTLNVLISNDENRFNEFAQYQIQNPMYAGDVFVGEAQEGGVGIVHVPTKTKNIFLAGQNTYVPKITKYGDKYALVTGDYHSMTLIYDISLADIGVGNVSYNPKDDLITVRNEIDRIIGKL